MNNISAMNRSIRQNIIAPRVNMGGVLLDQALPYKGVDQIDPFLLIHHWKNTYNGGQRQQDIGVGPHPHRGFAPVTFIFQGAVHHRDSTGKSEVVNAGGTQWMNSGKGIVHSERPSAELADAGGDFEIIQFWVNVPKAHKMEPPSYQPLTAEDTPSFSSEDEKVRVAVVAGELNGVKGKIQAYSDLLVVRLDFQQGGSIDLPIPEEYNALLYQLDGSLSINGTTKTGTKEMTWFNNDGKQVSLSAEQATRAILLTGKPIAEPVATYGPFVMNTRAELMQAVKDYQEGKMGTLEEKFDG